MPKLRNDDNCGRSCSPMNKSPSLYMGQNLNKPLLPVNRQASVSNVTQTSQVALNNVKTNESFFSGDGGAVIVGKLAAKLDCGSVLSQKSNNFKPLGPVNLTTINFEMNGSRNITFET